MARVPGCTAVDGRPPPGVFCATCGVTPNGPQPGDVPVPVLDQQVPACAPELNPQEDVWQFLRQDYRGNRVRVFNTYEHIVQACCDAWHALMQQPQCVTTIATRQRAKQVYP